MSCYVTETFGLALKFFPPGTFVRVGNRLAKLSDQFLKE